MTESDGYILIALMVLPLITAVGLMLVPSKERSAIVGITAISSLALFIMSVYVFAAYSFEGDTYQGVLSYPGLKTLVCLGTLVYRSRLALMESPRHWYYLPG